MNAEQAYHEIEPRLKDMLRDVRSMLAKPVDAQARMALHSIRFQLEEITGEWRGKH